MSSSTLVGLESWRPPPPRPRRRHRRPIATAATLLQKLEPGQPRMAPRAATPPPAQPQPPGGLQVLVKLGGAAITDKQQLETLNPEVLAASARQLAALYAEQQELGGSSDSGCGPAGLVVVHGAGSFGHQTAAASGVAAGGICDSTAVRQGFADTRRSVTKLNQLVVAALLEAGVPAVGVSPCGSWTTRRRRVVADGCDGVAALLAAGLVPVLHGDAVMDEALGCTILSGDLVITRLCERLRPPVVAFLVSAGLGWRGAPCMRGGLWFAAAAAVAPCALNPCIEQSSQMITCKCNWLAADPGCRRMWTVFTTGPQSSPARSCWPDWVWSQRRPAAAAGPAAAVAGPAGSAAVAAGMGGPGGGPMMQGGQRLRGCRRAVQSTTPLAVWPPKYRKQRRLRDWARKCGSRGREVQRQRLPAPLQTCRRAGWALQCVVRRGAAAGSSGAAELPS